MNLELEALMEPRGSKILRKYADGKSYQLLITAPTSKGGTSLDMVTSSGCLLIPPVSISEGEETYHVVAFDRKSTKRLVVQFRLKGKAEIVETREIDTSDPKQGMFMPLLNPFSKMTAMQVNALAASVASGHYRVPRRTSTGKIASSLGVPRATFQGHRKLAESKLMAALAPYVLSYAGASSLPLQA